jgi:hypothetical protein
MRMDFQDASLMKLQRTIHAKLVLGREGKREAVEREYDAWQRQLYDCTRISSRGSGRVRRRFGR